MPATTVLELDERWSFVRRRATQRWVGIALCPATRQVVGDALGDRSKETCRALWAAIPAAYQAGQCYSDCWEAYRKVIPAGQHTACSKQSGQTAHIERWNNT